jgi:hypothetical protein
MSFLDEQATGQIGIGEKASLGTLTRTRRKRRKGQRPQGTETYSLLPQNEFTDIVSSPTDITQVGIGQLLTAQGIPAAQVRNVFERYQDTGAAPIGDVGDVLYPQPEDDGDDDNDDDDIETQTDPYIPDPGLPDFTDPDNINFDQRGANLDAMSSVGVPFGLEANAARYDEDGNRIVGFKAAIDSLNPFSKSTSRAAPTGGGSGTSLVPLPEGQTLTPIAAPPAAAPPSNVDVDINAGGPSYSGPPSVSSPGGTGSGGGDAAAPGSTPDDGYGIFASGGTVKAKNKNSFMSMKGK